MEETSAQWISKTAFDCAAVRSMVFARTQCQSFDYLASALVKSNQASLKARVGNWLAGHGGHELARWMVNKVSPGVDVFLFARQYLADELIRQHIALSPDTQVVLLGAGLDTSALRILRERHSVAAHLNDFYEVDVPSMSQHKKRLVATLLTQGDQSIVEHIHYAPCDFQSFSMTESLMSAGFRLNQPTVWIWSGMIHYLSESTIEQTVRQMKNLSKTGSPLFFDFIAKEAFTEPERYLFNVTQQTFDDYGEKMRFGFYEGSAHVGMWLNQRDADLTHYYGPHDMRHVYENATGIWPAPDAAPWAHLVLAKLG